MKEWCLKHPILTFLLLDKLIVVVSNTIVDKYSKTEGEVVGEVMMRSKGQIKEIIDSTKPKNEIGFRAS